MGIYLNPGNERFKRYRNDVIYVDKTGIISEINRLLCTPSAYICMTRPRRFGKTSTAEMLAAYYGADCDSHELFADLAIAKDPNFEKHLNKYNVIQVDVQGLRDKVGPDDFEAKFTKKIISEMHERWPEYVTGNEPVLFDACNAVYQATRQLFVFILDEWDCIARNDRDDITAQKNWVDFLRELFKDGPSNNYTALVYLTGIFPIRKYGSQSALGHFREYSVVEPYRFAKWIGFTKSEVEELSRQYNMDYAELKYWYDGYRLANEQIYNPSSVAQACMNHECDMYWTKTESFESVKGYINMDFDGLKEAVCKMLAGEFVPVKVASFNNSMTDLNGINDLLTLLIHIGYLGYNKSDKTAFIPNEEVRQLLECAVEESGWGQVAEALAQADRFMKALWAKKTEKMGDILRDIHSKSASIIQYNDENSLACVLGFATYTARKDYLVIRELPTGEGFADLALIPRRNDHPAIILELKWDQGEETAIEQIKSRNYPQSLQKYSGKIILVGINYSKEEKYHQVTIEEWEK